MNTENELFGELHEQEEYGLFGNEHRRQYEAQQEALRQFAVISSVCTCTKFRETPMINGKHICSICNKPIVQTDL
jgi:hypothetical protein